MERNCLWVWWFVILLPYIASLRAEGAIGGSQGGKSLWRCFLLWSGRGFLQCPGVRAEGSHTVRQYVKMFSTAERLNATSSFTHTLFFSRTRRKCRCCCAFLTAAVVLVDQERLSAVWVPRNLKLWTLSTQSPLMKMGGGSALHFLKSRM